MNSSLGSTARSCPAAELPRTFGMARAVRYVPHRRALALQWPGTDHGRRSVHRAGACLSVGRTLWRSVLGRGVAETLEVTACGAEGRGGAGATGPLGQPAATQRGMGWGREGMSQGTGAIVVLFERCIGALMLFVLGAVIDVVAKMKDDARRAHAPFVFRLAPQIW